MGVASTLFGHNQSGMTLMMFVVFLDCEILGLPIDEEMRVLATSWHLRDQFTSRKKDVCSIIVPDGVLTIARWLFDGCTALISVRLPAAARGLGIDNYIFSGCTSLNSLTIPVGVTRIGNAAFSGCTSLTSVTIPEGVTTIGDEAFFGCTSLDSMTIPEGVTTIGAYTFSRCTSLASVTIPEGVTTIEAFTFSKCSSLAFVIIPEGVTTIEHGTFAGCSSLTSLIIPEGVTTIEFSAFSGCTSLASITLPDSLTKIQSYAFNVCDSLVSVVLPPRCDLGKNAFFNCKRLSFVVAPNELIKPVTMKEVFRSCPMLSGPTYTTPRSKSAVAKALGLEYWSPRTHHLCRPCVRQQVAHMILVLVRLELPIVVVLNILWMFPRHQIGR